MHANCSCSDYSVIYIGKMTGDVVVVPLETNRLLNLIHCFITRKRGGIMRELSQGQNMEYLRHTFAIP